MIEYNFENEYKFSYVDENNITITYSLDAFAIYNVPDSTKVYQIIIENNEHQHRRIQYSTYFVKCYKTFGYLT